MLVVIQHLEEDRRRAGVVVSNFPNMISLVIYVVQIWLLAVSGQNTVSQSDVLVRLSHGGQVRGAVLTSEKGQPFYAFMGIPYAEPPVGDLRFKAPIKKSCWPDEHVFDATKAGPVCTQYDSETNFTGKEDCLRLNVYTPKNATHDTPKSVMIFIHGGGFMMGGGTYAFYPPERLMDSDIVLVIINYRLDALGFLSTGDASSPGNYGLLDQSLAFKWVKDNIALFGGDKDSVAIFGESSGGASVSYHLVSPASKGLFNKAIAMSGSDLSTYALADNPLFWAQHLAAEVNCPLDPTAELVSCLRSKPVEELVLGTEHYSKFSSMPVPFAPTVDGVFITTSPRDTLSNFPEKINRVPVMSGCTEMEAAGVVDMMKQQHPNVSVVSEEGFAILFNNTITNQDVNISNMIRDYYFKSVDIKNEFEANMAVIKAASDGPLRMSHFEEVQLLSKAGLDVFVYSYDYATTHDFEMAEPLARRYGVGHAEDLNVLFNFTEGGGIRFEENDYKMVNIMTGVWSNFAKTGKPDPANKYFNDWKPSCPEIFQIYHLNLTISVEEYDVKNDETFKFWTRDVAAARNVSLEKLHVNFTQDKNFKTFHKYSK